MAALAQGDPLNQPEQTSEAPNGEPSAPHHSDAPDGPVSTLRGAGAQVDGRTVARGAVALVMATLAVLAVVFVVVGVHKNDQIDELRGQGVPVTFTITSCQGLLGGSGSNGAGYACRGTYQLEGHVYSEPLPGTAFFAPGATVHAIAVPDEPGLVSPATIVESEHASWNVYVLPLILFAAFLLIVAAVLVRRTRRHRMPPAQARGV